VRATVGTSSALDEELIKPWVKKFRSMDLNGEGHVDLADLRLMGKLSREEIDNIRRERVGRSLSLGGLVVVESPAAAEADEPPPLGQPVDLPRLEA